MYRVNPMGKPIPVDTVRRLLSEATNRLLGTTIQLSNSDWRAPSTLPGWSRAHVATHLARNADDIGWAALNERSERRPKTTSPEYLIELERGADQSALKLQLDLDSSAGALSQAIAAVPDWHRPITFGGYSYPLAILLVSRLHEICLHHLDLKVGARLDQFDPNIGYWLLRWAIHKRSQTKTPAIYIRSDSKVKAQLGQGEGCYITGADLQIWAWLCGREESDSVPGAAGIKFDLL